MYITSKGIEFTNFQEFSKFTVDNNLVGIIQLKEAIKDKTGNILIKELVSIKESAIKKLESMDGQYDQNFKIHMNNDMLEKLGFAVAKKITPYIDDSKDEFIKHLFDHSSSIISNYTSFIQSSFYEPKILLIFYRLMIERPEFFEYAIELSLLTLGTIIQKPHPMKFIHRHAFLGGFFIDMVYSESDYWKQTYYTEADMIQVSKLSSITAQNVGLSDEVVQSIEGNILPEIYTETKVVPLDYETLKRNSLLLKVDRGDSESENDPARPEAIHLLTEAMKIARFIKETHKKLENSKEDIVEQLLIMFTYNTEKGIFLKELAYPIIARFKEFKSTVSRIRKIAELENRCVNPPSAWAYPKPKATQILCKNKVYGCKYFVGGWDISIVNPQTALGYLGVPLNPGSYPKCKLEKELTEGNDSKRYS
jgi:hypothetical protein